MHNTHVISVPLVHASGVHGWAEHSARRAENVENCSKWPKMRTLMVGANEAHARLLAVHRLPMRGFTARNTLPLVSHRASTGVFPPVHGVSGPETGCMPYPSHGVLGTASVAPAVVPFSSVPWSPLPPLPGSWVVSCPHVVSLPASCPCECLPSFGAPSCPLA